MRRSEINELINEAIDFLNAQKFYLPKWAYWSPGDWRKTTADLDEIRSCMLGWDLTDFGSSDFYKIGLLLFTIRNGVLNHSKYGQKTYAEKILIVEAGQVTPMHYHWLKMEDIINRGGGNMQIKLHNVDADDGLADTAVTVSIDGIHQTVAAGEILTLEPGQSITLPPKLYHSFWAESGKLLLGEVSMVNDDHSDNRFYQPAGRFPNIEEDVPAMYCLFTDLSRMSELKS